MTEPQIAGTTAARKAHQPRPTPEPWDPFNPARTGTGGGQGWLPGMPAPEPQGSWQRAALQPAMSAGTARTIATSAAARARLNEAVALLQATERTVEDVESARDAAWTSALSSALANRAIVDADALSDCLLSALEDAGVIRGDRAIARYRDAVAEAVQTPGLAEQALDRIVEHLERTGPALLESSPEPSVAEASA